MKQLEELNEIASRQLSGITAGQDLKARILITSKEGNRKATHSLRVRVLSVCCALVVLVGTGTALYLSRHSEGDGNSPVFDSIAAGVGTGSGSLQADLLPGGITLSAGNTNPSYRSIWAPVSGSNYPLVCIGGKYYRLMRNPSSVSDSLKGDSLGTVSEKTDEPALSTAEIFSNTVEAGIEVFAVSGMKGAAIIAAVNGENRVFQRVSYAGHALVGSESLNDTLRINDHVTGLELSQVGTITDSTVCSALIDTLLANAVYQSAGGSADSANQALLIQLDNGLTVQLAVKDGVFIACGAWSCPEFIDAFTAAVQ